MNKKVALPLLGQPDPNVPKDVHLVGRYAVGITWGDGHGSIYPFDQLRRACPCGACGVRSDIAAWPSGITRTPEGLKVVWTDGHASLYPYPELRGGCRCAACTGGH